MLLYRSVVYIHKILSYCNSTHTHAHTHTHTHTHTEVENAFQRFYSLLTVHTAKYSVLVAPLRASMLEVQ